MKKKSTNATIHVRGTEIAVIRRDDDDYISLTDMVRNFDGGPALIEQWLKNKDTVLFLGVWEQLNNPDFKTPEFEGIKNEAGRNSFYLSAKKWMEATGARGLIEFIHMALPQKDRIKRLNTIAIRQMQTLTARTVKQLEGGEK